METVDQKIAALLSDCDEDKIDLIETNGLKIESVQYSLIKHYVCAVTPETTAIEECELHNDLERDGYEVKMSYLTTDGQTKIGKAFELTKVAHIIDGKTMKRAAEGE